MPVYDVVIFLPDGGTEVQEVSAVDGESIVRCLRDIYPNAIFLPIKRHVEYLKEEDLI